MEEVELEEEEVVVGNGGSDRPKILSLKRFAVSLDSESCTVELRSKGFHGTGPIFSIN